MILIKLYILEYDIELMKFYLDRAHIGSPPQLFIPIIHFCQN